MPALLYRTPRKQLLQLQHALGQAVLLGNMHHLPLLPS